METQHTETGRLIPVRMFDRRPYRLQRYGKDPRSPELLERLREKHGEPPIVARPLLTTTLLPGLNFVSADDLSAAAGDRKAGVLNDSNIRIKALSLDSLSAFEKRELVAQTTSRIALTRWRMNEQDPEIAKAIDARLTDSDTQD